MIADTLQHLVETPLAKALGWTLFHSLWEGAIVAIALSVVLCFTRSARIRYLSAGLALFVIFAGFVCTLALAMPGAGGPATAITLILPPTPVDEYPALTRALAQIKASDVLPWLAPFWMAGVILVHLRSLAGWIAARRLRTRGVCAAPDLWQQRLTILRARLGLSKAVALIETSLAQVPAVVGYLRPAILLPVGMLTGMPAGQIEAILLHELAHIRRHDYLANLLQTVVEGFLFYHPAVWWISGVIRTERENCCDDLVVAVNGNALEYAAALTALEQSRWDAHDAALAATGGNLMKRIRRLLYPLNSPRAALAPVFLAGVLAIAAALAAMAWQSPSPAPDNPFQSWLDTEVPYIITDAERAAFQSLQTDDERAHFIDQFWQRRDPTPGAPDNPFRIEHYRRMGYANAQFATRTGIPGWKTDRGKIYIKYGPPDAIDSHPSNEEWRYRFIDGFANGVIIEFVDPDGTGEYHMARDPR